MARTKKTNPPASRPLSRAKPRTRQSVRNRIVSPIQNSSSNLSNASTRRNIRNRVIITRSCLASTSQSELQIHSHSNEEPEPRIEDSLNLSQNNNNENEHRSEDGDNINEGREVTREQTINESLSQNINRRVEGYFLAIENTKDRKCKECSKMIKGSVWHLKDHLSSIHKDIAHNLGIHARDRSQKRTQAAQVVIPDEFFPKKQKITLDLNKTICGIIRLFLRKNYALSGADDWPKELHTLKQEFDAYNKTLNRRNLRKYIMQAAEQIYQLIANDLKGKLPSIMFDSASRDKRHVFSASLRYLNGKEIIERTLGMVTLHEQHRSELLKNELTSLLERVGLNLNEIYSTCTDQGANMLKAADLIIEAQTSLRIARDLEEQEIQSDDETDDELFNPDRVAQDHSVDSAVLRAELQEDFALEAVEDGQEDNEIHDELFDNLGTLGSKMVCGAHNLQLAAKDVSKEYNEKIKSARVLSQELNKSKYQRLIRQHNIGMMRTDIQPRWDSTYIMLDDLNKNMQKIKGINDPNLDLTDDVWLFIQEYVTAFLPVHIAMKEFQKTNLTMSDFYCKWISMQVQVTNTPDGINSISSRLKTAIINRARKFFESDAFVAALLLDPRFTWCGRNSVYDETLRDRGIVQCEKIHHSLNRLVMNPEQIPQYHTIDNNDFLAEESVLLGGGDQDDTEIDAQNQVLTIKQMIMKFLAEPRITSTERNRFNVLEYWHSKRDKSEWKVLYNISQVVYGTAFSQVKVERDFSGFALVLNHLRSKMSDDTLNAIMVIKYNLDLLQHVNFN